ncbi:ABC transporter ATP-binding protein [Xanthomonas phage Xoo-sp13]|nr:ABC transporter ATP-binding protein [Xanthomonas phage Xoo-sp13]
MKITTITPNIIQYTAKNSYELCSSFIRFQEFYESPFDDIRGKYFTMDTYMDRYAESKGGEFTYFEDWSGFNIPGHAIVEFVKVFTIAYTPTPLRDKEYALLAPLKQFLNTDDSNFYIIGNVEGADSVVDHELRHAAYYLNPEYKARCDAQYALLPEEYKEFLHKGLTKFGYHESAFPDEVQAYLGSSNMEALVWDIFGPSFLHEQEYLDSFSSIKAV